MIARRLPVWADKECRNGRPDLVILEAGHNTMFRGGPGVEENQVLDMDLLMDKVIDAYGRGPSVLVAFHPSPVLSRNALTSVNHINREWERAAISKRWNFCSSNGFRHVEQGVSYPDERLFADKRHYSKEGCKLQSRNLIHSITNALEW